MSRVIASRVYDLYGRFYDSFEMLFKRRLAKAISAIPFHSGDRVLDIGIGTGLSLEYYPSHVKVTGIDLSPGMLHQAQRKLDEGFVRADCPHEDTQLIQADALNLPFPDKSFDVVFLSHVISTVPDPQRCLSEAFRVAHDHAHIVMVNHFRSDYPVLSWVESAIDPICRKLGWRCDLSARTLLAQGGVENLDLLPHAEGFIFRIIYLEKNKNTVRLAIMPAPLEREPKFGPA